MNHFVQQSCAGFAEALASRTPVPGGGGAAAMTGALAVALCSMAGNFTAGKKKYEAVEADIQRLLSQGETLRLRLLELVDADADAFEPLSRAYAIAKDDPRREQILEEATRNACQVPVEIIRCCSQVLKLLEEMLEKGSRLLITDVGCGAILCRAAMESAALNVFVNTAAMKDRETARNLDQEVESLLAAGIPLADRIAGSATESVRKEN